MTLAVIFYPYHFVRAILSIPFCPMPFCPYTILSIPFCLYHFVRYHFVLEPMRVCMYAAFGYMCEYYLSTNMNLGVHLLIRLPIVRYVSIYLSICLMCDMYLSTYLHIMCVHKDTELWPNTEFRASSCCSVVSRFNEII